MINILIVEGQRLFSEGIEALLSTEQDFCVIGVATNKEEALKSIEKEQPDIILANLNMDRSDGIKLTIYMNDHYPETRVVLFTSSLDEKKIIEGVMAGADGILMQDITANNLIQSIRNAHTGQVVYAGKVAKVLAERIVDIKYDKKIILRKKLANRNVDLTAREVDVAYLLSEQKTNRQIAKALQLTEGTIKNYMSNLYSKLNVSDRTQMIDYIISLLAGKDDY